MTMATTSTGTTRGPDSGSGEAPPEAKRAKTDDVSTDSSDSQTAISAFSLPQKLLATTDDKPLFGIPSSLLENGKTRNDLAKLRVVFDRHGFRTSIVMSPRPALSIYKDSCHLNDDNGDSGKSFSGKEFLLVMLGLHELQPRIEEMYSSSVKNLYCLMVYCKLLREKCPTAMESQELKACIEENEGLCRSAAELKFDKNVLYKVTQIAGTATERVTQLTQQVVKADPRLRLDQLEHEYDRITYRNSTLSNAYTQLFLEQHDCCIKEIYFKRSHAAKYERITIFLYDPDADMIAPPRFTFLPSQTTMLKDGPETIAKAMVVSFWSQLLRRGYYMTTELKSILAPEMENYFLSGLAKDLSIPLKLVAHFSPEYPLSLYLEGQPGAGKSSLVRNFPPALSATIREYADPEVFVRFVKQNLNKPSDVLKLELEMRPNNNDMSVMSIIQGRRMTMGQTKPGLVVVGLEEMPSNDPAANPNQLETCRLISQRFSGRTGDYRDGKAPRNSEKRGIGGDATIIPVFTSNFDLDVDSTGALQRLEMFRNLEKVCVEPVSGEERKKFAWAYLRQCVEDRFKTMDSKFTFSIDIPLSDGDTRPLVRRLRMLAAYVSAMITSTVEVGGSVDVSILQKGSNCWINACNQTLEVKLGTMENYFPLTERIYDQRTTVALEGLREGLGPSVNYSELSIIIDFWLSRTLAPAVILSNDSSKIASLVGGLGALQEARSIPNIDASMYKMMRSLYDPTGTPNLRDDILQFGRGSLVAVELHCPTTDSQLCIREMIEDSPSMTAFSSERSALYKDGLFFGVHIEGEITPELRSRASLII